ncbi:dnaJ homolog subfamily C member 28 [Pelobates fuscus]|uniref:dnaJ homolog subfamily C member 28 n=1 Tax=Pelobates fuscus TaxID=191477 RepID=UPI002FE44EFE
MKLLGILLAQNSKYSFCAPVILYRILCQRSGLRLHSTFNQKRSIRDCCRVLNVPEDCSAEEVKHSYRNLAKKYHPDSGSITADANKFIQIDEAYRDLLAHLSEETRKGESLDDDDSATDFKIPQHRHYLSYEGVGYGTPSQRQKQYIQFRVDRASEHVLDFRKQKLERQSAENTMIAKDVKQSKKVKITQAVERLVEDLIQESMAKGDFDNLSGKGKPLQKFSYCPHVDPMTHNLNRILIDNGYQPEWIVLQKEIRESIEKLRSEALASRKKLGDPMTNATSEQWDKICEHLKEDISQLNKKINDFNLVVPLLNRQMVHFKADKVISQVEQAYLSLKENERKTSREKKADAQLDDKQFNLKQTLMSLIKQFKMS